MGVVSSCTHFGSSSAHPTAPRPSAPRQSAPQRRPSSLRSHLLALPRRQRSPKTLSSLAQAAPRATARRVVRARGARQRWRRMLAQVWIVRLVWGSPAARPRSAPSLPTSHRRYTGNTQPHLSPIITQPHLPNPHHHHPSPFTLHPSPFTPHPSSFTSHAPLASHLSPSPSALALRPTPYTLHRQAHPPPHPHPHPYPQSPLPSTAY